MKDDACFAIIGRAIRGGSPWDDEVHLDGFYHGRGLAMSMFNYYKKEFPQFDVFLVKVEAAEFRSDQEKSA